MEKQNDLIRRQKQFYETKQKNVPTKIWSFFRNGILNKVRKDIGVEKEICELHKTWLGDLSSKKVLDLGCFEGNVLTMYLAQEAKEYLAIDLSESAIIRLNSRLKDIKTARAIAVDFLSDEFQEQDFDLIYAYGVLHHFKDTNHLIERLKEKLKPQGEIVSYDPLQTSLPIKILRSLYRPFQSDRAWEWPFTKHVYYKWEEAFNVKDRRAILGKAKWFFLLKLLPWKNKEKDSLLKKWHSEDWQKSKASDTYMFKCMHLTMLMQNKTNR